MSIQLKNKNDMIQLKIYLNDMLDEGYVQMLGRHAQGDIRKLMLAFQGIVSDVIEALEKEIEREEKKEDELPREAQESAEIPQALKN